MIRMVFKCDDEDDMKNKRDRCCEALVGSPGFINDEIMITNSDNGNDFEIIIGENNDKDLEYHFKLLDK